MPQSPRLNDEESQTTKRPQSPASMLLLATALDTTWRAFLPTIGGTFLGIGIDHMFNIAPTGTIICIILGTATAALLITKQLRDVRKQK